MNKYYSSSNDNRLNNFRGRNTVDLETNNE